MDRQQAEQEIKARIEDYLRWQGINPDKPFRCLNPDHQDNNPSMSLDRQRHKAHCFGCGADYSTLDLIGIQEGITDTAELYKRAYELFHIDIDRPQHQNQPKTAQHTQDNIHNNTYTTTQPAEAAAEEADYTQFFLQANKDLLKTTYHRGISIDTLNRYKVGYVEKWTHPADGKHFSPRLIIPTSKTSYLARDTRENPPADAKPFAKMKVGKMHIFNYKGLAEAKQPVFIVEGEIDALSIIDAGGEAIALGSTAMVKSLLKQLESQKPSQPFIISLDNDKAGGKAADELEAGLKGLDIAYFRLDIAAPHKDANEALNADRAAFTAAVLAAVEQAESIVEAAREAQREQLQREAVSYYLPTFIKGIEESKEASFIPTGFKGLDELLDGGLYAGLYIVGAISSLGKTTFCLQIADQIAQAGQDALIFSLEMARKELIAKSVSRLTFIKGSGGGLYIPRDAKTTRGILTGSRYKNYSQKERQLIDEAIKTYSEYAKHIYITEGLGEVGIDQIRDKVKQHLTIKGKAPVVIIDYLQIIAPADIRATDKQNTDKAVLELKRLSRDYNIPVIGISSFNRDNYTAPVNLASFKESGAIEYSSDVLIGLQYEGMDYQEGEADKAREKRIRELMKQAVEDGKNGKPQKIQVKVLKNRNGSKGSSKIYYYPMFNYFTERLLLQEIDQEDGDADIFNFDSK